MLARQRGMTMWSAAFVIAVVVFFLFIGFKLFPVYMESFKIEKALEGVASQPNAGTKTRTEILNSLSKRFDIDDVEGRNLGSDWFSTEKQGRTLILRISYERVVPLFYNISVLIDFDFAREVPTVE